MGRTGLIDVLNRHEPCYWHPLVPSSGESGNRFVDTAQTQTVSVDLRNRDKCLILLGERGGTRTLDPMIKSHVLYRLSYALTAALCRGPPGAGQ